jgi:hypothetical protein
MIPACSSPAMSRRQVLRAMLAAAGATLLPPVIARAGQAWQLNSQDEAFLDQLERLGCLFFWEQASPSTGQVLDRARHDLGGRRDRRRMASIASTGFGLTALCIADKRGYLPHALVLERVKTTLAWHLNHFPEIHGFFYHFSDLETGARFRNSEVSSIDTSILLCGMLTAKAYFDDPQISAMAQQIYERVDWPWLLNGGSTFSMGWMPQSGFLRHRWDHYCELMMIYLLAIGSPSHPVSPELWKNFTRPIMNFEGYSYISGTDPIFTHQYSHAWFDFRRQRDEYTDYFENSVIATRAHKAFCLAHPRWFNQNYWGVTASDSIGGYTGWGGPPAMGPLDGTVVPSAAAGSLPFLPGDCVSVLRAMREQWGERAWSRYGFVDAFHPAADWYDRDVIGIDQGISVLMAENLRSGFVWKNFMSNAEAVQAMQLVGFRPECSKTA